MQTVGIPKIFAAINVEARESETTTFGANRWIASTSALIWSMIMKEARKGPGFTVVCLKSIVPSGFTLTPTAGASMKGNPVFSKYSNPSKYVEKRI